jgi:hypothetical protein
VSEYTSYNRIHEHEANLEAVTLQSDVGVSILTVNRTTEHLGGCDGRSGNGGVDKRVSAIKDNLISERRELAL